MRVLVCDDHQLLAEALGTVLRARGDIVVLTDEPRKALRVAREEQAFDLCLMDRSFRRRGDGIEAARRLREVAPSLRVVMLTADVDAATVRAALAVGVRAVLRKDDQLRGILAAVDEVMLGELVVTTGQWRRPVVTGKPLPAALTPREQEVLERVVRGQSTHVIAAEMGISYSTARTHAHAMMSKLGVQSRLQAAAFAIAHGLVRQTGAAGRGARCVTELDRSCSW
jgi:two-component system nitrate/nitrite response regulator NarL